MMHSTLMEEDFPARLEAVFPDRASANAASAVLCQHFELDASQLGIADHHSISGSHRNRFAVRASGRQSQKRQVLIAVATFGLLAAAFAVMAVLEQQGLVSPQLISLALAALVLVAVLPLVAGMLSWRRAGVRGDANLSLGEKTVLLVDVHDVSEQYRIREALRELGAVVDSSDIAGTT